jgi:outer membrane lipoprotein-sorting protein
MIMRKINSFIVAILLIPVGIVQSQDLPEILDNHYNAINIEALLEVENMQFTGTSYQMGMETSYTNIIARPMKSYMKVDANNQVMKQGYNGSIAWMISPWSSSPGPVVLDDVQTFVMRFHSDIDGVLWQYKKKGFAGSYVGKQSHDNGDAYVVELFTEGKGSHRLFIDPESYLVVKHEIIYLDDGGETITTSHISDYKTINGIPVPHEMEILVNGELTQKITVNNVEFNVEVDDSIFNIPSSTQSSSVTR